VAAAFRVGKHGISTTTLAADVYSYVFNQKGLMGGIALQGLKISQTK
jgi:lipid-binding SYLF domain-containing protein